MNLHHSLVSIGTTTLDLSPLRFTKGIDFDFAAAAIAAIAADSGRPFVPAGNRFEAIAARDSQMELMGAVNTVAVGLLVSNIVEVLRLVANTELVE